MNKGLQHLVFSVSLLGGVLLSSPSWAYLGIHESGDIVPQNQYQFGVAPQLLLNHGGGGEGNIFFDAPINDSTSARIALGGGTVDFNAMASVKFVPFPDVDNQPAMGVRLGVGAARKDSENIFVGQVAPLLSKKIKTDIGLMDPYVAIPLELVNVKSDNDSSSQFVFGTEWTSPDLPQARFGAELGMELNKAFSYVSVFVTLPFDSSKGVF